MGISAVDYDGHPLTYPVGVDLPAAPVGPDIFDSFKDSQGRFRTQSLFTEYLHESYPAHFTLKKKDVTKKGVPYVSLYKKYMEIADPTEYQVAIRLFGSWDHWQALCKARWFKEHLDGWRQELKVKLESDRYYEMTSHVQNNPDSPQSIQASKWLADRYGEKPKRGRPSKAEKAAHLKRIEEETSDVDDDAKRLGLGVN